MVNNKDIEVKVKLEDMELFQLMIDILHDVLEDKRIPEHIRDDYSDRIVSITEECKGSEEFYS